MHELANSNSKLKLTQLIVAARLQKLWGKGYLKFRAEHWSEVSDEAVELVRRLLERDPDKRIGDEDSMGHPWILLGKEETARLGLATPEHGRSGAGAEEESFMGSAAAAAAGRGRKKRPLSKGYSARLRHISVNERSRKRSRKRAALDIAEAS